MTIAPQASDWGWRARDQAPPPQAVVAWGEAARRLHSRLSSLADEPRARLAAAAGDAFLAVIGPAAFLPWVDGVGYAAPASDAPGLWLPTDLEPSVPAELLVRALGRTCPRRPLLLWPEPQALLPLDRVAPVSTELLDGIRRHWQGLDPSGVQVGAP